MCMGQLGVPPVCPLLPMVQWGSPSVSITSHGTVGWDGHLRFGVLCMGQLGVPPVCPLLPTVQWDGMDTWDLGCCAWDSLGFPSVSIISHGTVGWDGHLGLAVLCMGQLRIPTVCPLIPTVQ